MEEVPGSPGRLRFAHALIRDALYDELTSARRSQLHARVGEALEAVHSEDASAYLTELAHHFFAAVPAVSADRAVAYTRRAADQAAAQLAYEEAARLYAMGLALIGDGVERCDLLISLGDARARAGETGASKQAFRRGVRARRADLLERADGARRARLRRQDSVGGLEG